MIVFTAAALMALIGAAVSWMRGGKPELELASATEPTAVEPATTEPATTESASAETAVSSAALTPSDAEA
jgi:hypothetical protein